jgi:hypothetical protein
MITKSTGSMNYYRGIGHRWHPQRTVKPHNLRHQSA